MKQPNVLNWIKNIWAPIAGFISAVILVVEFFQLWKGDRALVSWATAELGLLTFFFILLWIGFSKEDYAKSLLLPTGYHSKQPRYPRLFLLARLGIVVFFLVACVAGVSLYNRMLLLESKIVILVSNFDGPDPQNFRVSDILITKLEDGLKNYNDVALITVNDDITAQEGSQAARQLGKRYQADYVLWGWYGVTNSNALLTLHVENMNPQLTLPMGASGLSQKITSISDMESFTLQQNLASQMTALIQFISGLVSYNAKHYDYAISRFSDALNEGQWNDDLISQSAVFFYRGNSYYSKQEYEYAVADLSRAIQINPKLSMAYNNRGAAYSALNEYERAFNDFSVAIQLDSNILAYHNRAIVRSYLISDQRENEIRSTDAGYYALMACLLHEIDASLEPKVSSSAECYRNVIKVGKSKEVKQIAEDWLRSYGEEP
jgi:tetratricopeptide (TPR) repeat protein